MSTIGAPPAATEDSGTVLRPEPPPGEDHFNEKDASVLVYVPGGTYTLGSDDLGEHEQPLHQVRLSPFLIGKYPVTNEQYRRFLESGTGYRKPAFWGEESFNRPLQPVVGVSWDDAMAYCEWAGLQLPTEAQWEAAARGPDARPFPWGDEPPTPDRANYGTFAGKTTPVGSFPAGVSPLGAHDMIGNVAEWCADVPDPVAYDRHERGQVDPVSSLGEAAAFRIVRGGSWLDQAGSLPVALRGRYWARQRRRFIGFRCVLPLAE